MRIRTLAFAATAGLTYSALETRSYRLRERRIVVARTAPALTILHVTDSHLTSGSHRLRAWLRDLPEKLDTPPDIAVATGDLIDDNSGIDPLAHALAGLRGRLGSFYVFGSHDYIQSTGAGALRSLAHRYSGARPPVATRLADFERLKARLEDVGWSSLNNDSTTLEHEGRRIRISGVDDPFMNLHTTEHVVREPNDDLAVGLVHAPDMVSEWILAGYDLVLAGHTHGGQVRLPVVGALVTNCSLPSALAGGAHKVGAGWLHVSPGLGTSKFSPIRFLCPPEVTLLRLVPA